MLFRDRLMGVLGVVTESDGTGTPSAPASAVGDGPVEGYAYLRIIFTPFFWGFSSKVSYILLCARKKSTASANVLSLRSTLGMMMRLSFVMIFSLPRSAPGFCSF